MTEQLPTFRKRLPDFVSQIVAAERLKSSVNGNPRFRVTFADCQTLTTQSDSSVSYDVENFRGRGDQYGPRVAVWLSRAGRIEAMTKL